MRPMKFSWFLALRYLKPKRTFISIITVISVLGVALGVGVLIVVIAVMSGFEKRIKDEWLRVESPVYVKNVEPEWQDPHQTPEERMKQMDEMLRKLKGVPGVTAAAPYLEVQSMIQRGEKRSHDAISIEVTPGSLPPEPTPGDAPPPEDEAPRPQENRQPPQSPEPGTAATPEMLAEEEDPPAALPAKDANAVEAETGINRRHPLAPALIRGVDLDDAESVNRFGRRFRELLKRTKKMYGREIPQAWGEFDLAGETIVLSEDLVRKIQGDSRMYVPGTYRDEEGNTVEGAGSYVNVFGPHFLNEGFDILEEQRQAKDDPELKKKLDAADRDYPLPENLMLTGIFNDDKMQGLGFVSLKTARRLVGDGANVEGFAVDTKDPYDAPAMAQRIRDSGILPETWGVETWIDRHRAQFDAVANERGMMYIVLAFISIVAAFCIMNTMITMAVMKRREIGMMRALGAKISHIVGLFMTKGFIVGLMGTGLGYVIGRLVLHYRNELRQWINDRFGHQIFSSEIYGLWEIPADLRTVDQLIICGLAFILCTLAAVPPAWIVGRMQPAQALRSDR
jgi:ABC-type lipoprotein release transport system permease subunit